MMKGKASAADGSPNTIAVYKNNCGYPYRLHNMEKRRIRILAKRI
jgi:hypothetical protein